MGEPKKMPPRCEAVIVDSEVLDGLGCFLDYHYLVGGLEHVLFSIIYGIIFPID